MHHSSLEKPNQNALMWMQSQEQGAQQRSVYGNTRRCEHRCDEALRHSSSIWIGFFFQLPAYFYRWILSPFFHALCGPGCGCRFEPSCSRYWIESLKKHGPYHGLRLSLSRLARCHPWNSGGYDPIPESLRDRKVEVKS